MIYLQTSRDFPKYNLDLYSGCDVHRCFPIRNYVGSRGTQRPELGDPKELEEARFYRRNSINECVDSRPGWSKGRQLALILSIGRRVYGTLIRFVSPSASTVPRFGTGRGKERKRGCEEEYMEGMGTTR